MKTSYSIRVKTWTETNRGGNMSEHYFGGYKKNGEPRFVGIDKKKVWQKPMFVDYYRMKLKNWFNSQLWVGDFDVEIVKN